MRGGYRKRKMKFGNQERLLRLIPNRETKMEIDAETPRQIEAEWMKQRMRETEIGEK